MYRLLTTISIFFIFPISCESQNIKDEIVWQPGYLDIHFIHTGCGNTSFMVFPDGTTLLYDAGDAKQRKKFPYYEPFGKPKSSGKQIVDYIQRFSPRKEIDFALISHFHSDHYGEVTEDRDISKNGKYVLTGITEVGDLMNMKKIIDRGNPKYIYPVDRRYRPGSKTEDKPKEIDPTFSNYLEFIAYHKEKSNLQVERLEVGSTTQIGLKHDSLKYPDFEIRNVKSNNQIWTGNAHEVREIEFQPPLVMGFGYYNENPLSLTLKISYGDFDYYVGGDTSGTNAYPDYDIEAELLRVIGEVDAMSLNHHGHHDSNSLKFLKALRPQVIAHQGIHDPHFPEILQENLSKVETDVFALSIGKNILERDSQKIKKNYKSTKGNFIIRVSPSGKTFKILVINPKDNTSIKEVFGPYISRN